MFVGYRVWADIYQCFQLVFIIQCALEPSCRQWRLSLSSPAAILATAATWGCRSPRHPMQLLFSCLDQYSGKASKQQRSVCSIIFLVRPCDRPERHTGALIGVPDFETQYSNICICWARGGLSSFLTCCCCCAHVYSQLGWSPKSFCALQSCSALQLAARRALHVHACLHRVCAVCSATTLHTCTDDCTLMCNATHAVPAFPDASQLSHPVRSLHILFAKGSQLLERIAPHI